MKNIIDDLVVEKEVREHTYFEELKAAGFTAPKIGFPRITPDAILDYLEKCATHINKQHGYKSCTIKRFPQDLRVFVEPFSTWKRSSWRGTFNLYWQERNISECRHMRPPLHVLRTINRYKNEFYTLKIVTVEEVKYPLVVGIMKDDDTRYLLDWWDNDIDITQIDVN